MATHSSVLVWRIPWTEEPGGLQSTGFKESDTTEQLTPTGSRSGSCGHCFLSVLNGAEEAFTEAMKSQGPPSTLFMGSVA